MSFEIHILCEEKLIKWLDSSLTQSDIYCRQIDAFYFFLFQTYDAEDSSHFDNFDQVDDAQRHCDAIKHHCTDNLDSASRDLLNRLMEKNPQHRLKSILALRRIAFFHNFNFDDVRHMKVNIKRFYFIYFSYSLFFMYKRYRQENWLKKRTTLRLNNQWTAILWFNHYMHGIIILYTYVIIPIQY